MRAALGSLRGARAPRRLRWQRVRDVERPAGGVALEAGRACPVLALVHAAGAELADAQVAMAALLLVAAVPQAGGGRQLAGPAVRLAHRLAALGRLHLRRCLWRWRGGRRLRAGALGACGGRLRLGGADLAGGEGRGAGRRLRGRRVCGRRAQRGVHVQPAAGGGRGGGALGETDLEGASEQGLDLSCCAVRSLPRKQIQPRRGCTARAASARRTALRCRRRVARASPARSQSRGGTGRRRVFGAAAGAGPPSGHVLAAGGALAGGAPDGREGAAPRWHAQRCEPHCSKLDPAGRARARKGDGR
mmetsp:Transcript_71034/g.219284  ORF Transcript_71034/g.219284 Transcript_71034/m.219284 type:complete len:304 (+) Transcript_71034:989-1900(+)